MAQEDGTGGHYEWRGGDSGEAVWVPDPAPTPAPAPTFTPVDTSNVPNPTLAVMGGAAPAPAGIATLPGTTPAPAGIATLAGTTPAPAPATTTPAPAPASTASGKFVTDYQGNKFDTGMTLALAKQIAGNFDKGSSGTAFTTQGQSIGFNYDQAKELLGKDPNAAQQVLLDMARQLQQKGITDLSQVGTRTVDVAVPTGGESQDMRTEQQKEFYNKNTGERISGVGEFFGQTYTGKGGTGYQLVDKDGQIGLAAKGFDTGDKELISTALMALSAIGAPMLSSAISGMLPGAAITGTAAAEAGALGMIPATAGNQLASQAITRALMNAGVAKLTGQDALKAALIGGASPFISAGIGSVLPSDALGKTLTNIGTSAVTGALQGGDIGKILQNSVMGGIAGQALGQVGIPSQLAPLLVSLARSGTITPYAAMQIINQMNTAKKGP